MKKKILMATDSPGCRGAGGTRQHAEVTAAKRGPKLGPLVAEAVRRVRLTQYLCTCQRCGHVWRAQRVPATCARCKQSLGPAGYEPYPLTTRSRGSILSRMEVDMENTDRKVAKREALSWGRLCVALIRRVESDPESPLAQSWAANAAQAATVAFGHARVALGYTIEASR